MDDTGPPPSEAALQKKIPHRGKNPERKQKDEKGLRKHILFIGETGNGESTLIRQMGVYASNTNIDPEIGSGMIQTHCLDGPEKT